MTLTKQLFLLMLAMLIGLLAASFYTELRYTRAYLAAQLSGHAQDTATSLGVVLAPMIARADLPLVQSTVDAIFDRGYYRSIRLTRMDGELIYQRNNPPSPQDVPHWFVDWFELPAPQAELSMSQGWLQVGKLAVASHPGLAYAKLWDHAASFAGLALVGLVLAAVLLAGLLRWLLRPLKLMEQQARAICNHQFEVQPQIPRSRELRGVVLAMNSMSRRMEQTIQELSQYAEHMRQEAFADGLTELWNRRGLEERLRHALQQEGHHGVALMLRLHKLACMNDRIGYPETDQTLVQVALLLKMAIENFGHGLAARIRAADFVLLLPGASQEEAEAFSTQLLQHLQQLKLPSACAGSFYIGLVSYQQGMEVSGILAAADNALARAVSTGGNHGCYFLSPDEQAQTLRVGHQQWRDRIQLALDNKSLYLAAQPVMSLKPRQVLYYEFFVRIKDEQGELIPANAFIPMAERLGRVAELDLAVISQVIALLDGASYAEIPLSINLSLASILSPNFTFEVEQLLEGLAKQSRRLIFEIPEFSIVQNSLACREFARRVKAKGARIAIDHFGVVLNSMNHVRDLHADFIKIDGSYIRELALDKEKQHFLHSLVHIAHGLHIQVIAECTETEADCLAVESLHLDAAQGFYFNRPNNL